MSSAPAISSWRPALSSVTPPRRMMAEPKDRADQLPTRGRRVDRRRVRHACAAARPLPWRLDEHGELHHRVPRHRDLAATRAVECHGPGDVRSILRSVPHRLLLRIRRGIPCRPRHQRHAHPDQLPPFRIRRTAEGPHRGWPKVARPGRGHAGGSRHVLDHRPAPGFQNHHWHSDNPTHWPLFWEYTDFKDRAIWLWEVLADHYRGNGWVAGFNLLNEPADEDGTGSSPGTWRQHVGYVTLTPTECFSSTGIDTRLTCRWSQN